MNVCDNRADGDDTRWHSLAASGGPARGERGGASADDCLLSGNLRADVFQRPRSAPFSCNVQGYRARVSIADGDVVDGKIPPSVARILKEWTALRHEELMRNWIACRTDGQVERIEGLDT